MEGASKNPGKENDGAKDPESEDFEKGYSAPATDNSIGAPECSMTIPDFGSSTETELEEIIERPEAETGSEGHSGRMKSRTSLSPERSSHEESQVAKADGIPEPGPAIIPLEKMPEPPSEEEPPSEDTMTPLPSTGRKGHPTILGGVRREGSSIYKSGRETLDSMAANMLQKPFKISVSMQTDASWLYDHSSKKKPKMKLKKDGRLLENDIYAVLSQDLSSLDILCDTEFKEEFIKLFQESLKTLSSVGPPTILAYRRELSRGDIEIGLEEECPAHCEFCGSLLRDFPSFESLQKIEEYGPLFCCPRFRSLLEFLVTEKERIAKMGGELINIAPHKAHGTEAERKLARERARQRMRERQMAKQLSFLLAHQEKDISPVHSTPEYNRQLKTISYILSQEPPSSASWTTVPLVPVEQRGTEEITYSVSCCDFTIAGGKLLKNQFLQQYYKNGVKFLTMFPDGTAQIFYPSGNLAVIVVQKKEDSGYICIVQEDRSENADIQAVFESSGQGSCYHPNGIVWINITIRGGHYADQDGNKVRTWIWPNHLQKYTPTVSFKPVFVSLNQNVGVRILGQDKVAISFLAMGKQAKINVGTKVEPSTDHHPWPKHVSEDDLVLFASRIKILKVFAKLHGCLEFSSCEQWTKIQLPSYISKQALKLMNLCRESAVSAALDKLIMSIINVTA
ncbi:glutamate-rich protein 6 isoform X2 [Eublepharis macularius]|uniref:Glutamate-rich protein 6 isoform X2 n=1 Tax=Eublepharis macularius TaxID=481883 RepID=A0AA97JMH2_EUBMA|nr:glutamate-rich protein 6 isoform X2 [Eublepharis macularius]